MAPSTLSSRDWLPKAGNQSQANLHYQAALDGTWKGNGYDRRREVRLEWRGT